MFFCTKAGKIQSRNTDNSENIPSSKEQLFLKYLYRLIETKSNATFSLISVTFFVSILKNSQKLLLQFYYPVVDGKIDHIHRCFEPEFCEDIIFVLIYRPQRNIHLIGNLFARQTRGGI